MPQIAVLQTTKSDECKMTSLTQLSFHECKILTQLSFQRGKKKTSLKAANFVRLKRKGNVWKYILQYSFQEGLLCPTGKQLTLSEQRSSLSAHTDSTAATKLQGIALSARLSHSFPSYPKVEQNIAESVAFFSDKNTQWSALCSKFPFALTLVQGNSALSLQLLLVSDIPSSNSMTNLTSLVYKLRCHCTSNEMASHRLLTVLLKRCSQNLVPVLLHGEHNKNCLLNIHGAAQNPEVWSSYSSHTFQAAHFEKNIKCLLCRHLLRAGWSRNTEFKASCYPYEKTLTSLCTKLA